MSKSNWAGGSGWKAIADPTAKLSGRVLVATAGVSQFAEDYLLTLAGTTTAFDKAHYATQINYAFPSDVSVTTFNAGMLGLISRATGLTSTPITAQDCYLARINARDSLAQIIRRNAGVETTIAQSTLPTNTFSFGVLHTMRLNTYGTNPVNLQFLVDDTTLVTVGDSSSSALTTGYAGIQVNGGTAYVDNFTLLEFTEDGTDPYTGWVPTSSFTTNQLIAWYKSESGISYHDSASKTVDQWDDQSGNAIHLSKADTTTYASATRPVLVEDSTIKAIRFDNAEHQMLAANWNIKLALRTADKGICWAALVKTYKEPIGDIATSSIGDDQTIGSMLNVGRNYDFQFFNDPTSSDALKTIRFRNGASSAFSSGTTAYSIGDYSIYVFNANGTTPTAGTTDRGFFRNGTQIIDFTTNAPSNIDESSEPPLLVGRRSIQDQSLEDHAYGTFDIVEMQLYGETILGADRTKVEGYFAWKYGLQTLLPSDHPYKNSQPS